MKEEVVFLRDTIIYITPQLDHYGDLATSSLIDDSCVERESSISCGKLHLIKRSAKYFSYSYLFHINDLKLSEQLSQISSYSKLNLELAIFLDEAAYRSLSPLVGKNDTNIRNMLLAYVNGLHMCSVVRVSVSPSIYC